MVKYFDVVVVAILLLFVFCSQSFSIDGNRQGKRAVYYDHFEYTDNVDFHGADGINIDYSAELNVPGDYYEIAFDAINDTSTDVKLSQLSFGESDPFVIYELFYENGEKLHVGDLLKQGETKKIIYRVSYQNKIDIEEYQFDGSFYINYEQFL